MDFFRGRGDKSWKHEQQQHSDVNSFRRKSSSPEREPPMRLQRSPPKNKMQNFMQMKSSRQQIKFLMEKTQKEANWDMDNDSDVRGGSDDDADDEVEQLNAHYSDPRIWRAIDALKEAVEPLPKQICGVGGTWGSGFDRENFFVPGIKWQDGNRDIIPPFLVQYECRMENIRRALIKPKNRYRLRMMAYATLQYNPLKQNKFLDRKRAVLSKEKAVHLTCGCQRTKRLSKMSEDLNTGKNKLLQKSYNCGEKCVNRCTNCECSKISCPSALYCTNRHFQLF
jgi:hypothetical protein